MDRWAAEYGEAATFICVGCAGPALANQFGQELQLAHCYNTYVPRGKGPFWGQLGCQGFILMDAQLNVVCPASLPFMQVRGKAFEHVETLLDLMITTGAHAHTCPKPLRVCTQSHAHCLAAPTRPPASMSTNNRAHAGKVVPSSR